MENISFPDIDQIFDKHGDPRTKKLLLMKSVWFPICIMVAYLLFVLVGPRFMRNRKPMNVTKFIMAYNILQVVLNAYLFIKIPQYGKISLCIEVDYSESEIGWMQLKLSYYYLLLKLVDLADTVFFVLKKNFHQISFIHVYHHCVMIIITWMAVKFVGGGQSGYIGFFNAAVHSLMYTYYFLTALNPEYKKSSFKKIVTKTQLAQFVSCAILFGYAMLAENCKYHRGCSTFIFFHALLFLYMFGNFYFQTYIRNKSKSS